MLFKYNKNDKVLATKINNYNSIMYSKTYLMTLYLYFLKQSVIANIYIHLLNTRVSKDTQPSIKFYERGKMKKVTGDISYKVY